MAGRGDTLGRYTLRDKIGSGGMGAVFRAEDDRGAPFAIKVLGKDLGADAIRRFVRESKIRIPHENVIRVFDAGVSEGGELYIVLELLEGESLASVLKRGPEPIGRVADVALQALAGLEAAHARGVIHRDIKPANIFRTSDGTIKVLDFGIALLGEDEDRITTSGKFMGTPAYLSPEQARGDREIDAQADVWALGAVLYEMLTGAPVFARTSLTGTLLAIVQHNPPPVHELVPSVPVALSEAIARSISKAKGRRWKNATELRRAIEAVDVTLLPPPQAPPSRKKAAPALPAGEERIVAVLLAEGVRDLPAIERAVEERGGALIRLLGQRAIGLFGAERWVGDELERAASAALAARGACTRIAVSSGRASGGDGGISGEVIQLAESICEQAEGVAIDATSARMIDETFETRPIAGTDVSTIERRRKGATFSLGDSELLGRERELEVIRDALDRLATKGESTVLYVSGPQGIGKSRLAQELVQLMLRGPMPGVFSSCRAESMFRDTAFSLIANLLRDHLGGASAEKIRALVDRVMPDPKEAERTAVFLAEVIGLRALAEGSIPGVKSDARWVLDRMRLAVAELFRGLCAKGPLVLIADDLQWADRASRELILGIPEFLQGLPFLLFVTTQESDAPREGFVHLQPRSLDPGEVARFVRARVRRRLSDAMLASIQEKTGGNPFYLEQIVGALAQESGDIDRVPLPISLEAAVQSRLDRLPAEEKTVLKHAAIFGRPFDAAEVESLGFIGASQQLDALCEKGMLAAKSSRYHFASTLIAEVAYRMIAPDPRRELHAAFAQIASGRDEVHHEEVASHFERGGLPARAAEHYVASALVAARHFDSATVLRCATRASELDPLMKPKFELELVLAEALSFFGRKDEQLAALERAERSASTDAERAIVLAEESFWMASKGRLDDALARSERAVAEAERAGDDDVIMRALGRRVIALIYASRLDEASAACDRAMEHAERASLHSLALVAGWRAQIASSRGDLGARRDAFASAIELYELAGDVRRAAGARTNLADLYNRVGAYEEAERSLRAALEGCRRVGYRLMEGYALLNLGYARSMAKSAIQARAALDDAAAIAAETNDKRLAILVRIYRARWLYGADRPSAAAQQAEQAAETASAHAMRGLRANALWVAARAWHEAGELDRALACSTEALAIRDELGSIEEDEADLFLTHALVLRARGREKEAREVIERGKRRLHAIAETTEDPDWRRRLFEDVETHRRLLAL